MPKSRAKVKHHAAKCGVFHFAIRLLAEIIFCISFRKDHGLLVVGGINNPEGFIANPSDIFNGFLNLLIAIARWIDTIFLREMFIIRDSHSLVHEVSQVNVCSLLSVF